MTGDNQSVQVLLFWFKQLIHSVSLCVCFIFHLVLFIYLLYETWYPIIKRSLRVDGKVKWYGGGVFAVCRYFVLSATLGCNLQCALKQMTFQLDTVQTRITTSESQFTILPEQRGLSHPGDRGAAAIRQPYSSESLRSTVRLTACHAGFVSGRGQTGAGQLARMPAGLLLFGSALGKTDWEGTSGQNRDSLEDYVSHLDWECLRPQLIKSYYSQQ